MTNLKKKIIEFFKRLFLIKNQEVKEDIIDLSLQTNARHVDKIIIHCSATKPMQDFHAGDIRKWHLDRGWKDIGYHFVIARAGSLESGRDLDGDGDIFEEVGAHTYGYNKNSIGICLIGGVDAGGKPESNFTQEQWKMLERLVRVLKAQFPHATVHGHNEFANKACPSFYVPDWLKSVNL